jgi:hypothetical protein
LNPFAAHGASHGKQQTIEIMKPTPLTLRGNRCSPLTDYNYRPVALDSFNTNCARLSPLSLWDISRDYFKNEARHDFLGEAALFATIICTAFLPLISNAHPLVEFVRAIGNF